MLPVFVLLTNKKQYLDILHIQIKKNEWQYGMHKNDFDILIRSVHFSQTNP